MTPKGDVWHNSFGGRGIRYLGWWFHLFSLFPPHPPISILETSMEKVIAVLALLVQILNAGAFVTEAYIPKYAILIAAVTGGIQAFLGKIQEPKGKAKK